MDFYLVMICVTFPEFTIKVNGEGHGFFWRKERIEARRPHVPLLFVLVMKYLSRSLKCMSLPDFLFHPMCKQLKFTHLIFGDDLMIFCKGNLSLVWRIIEALSHFSKVIGLVANMDKSSIFMAREQLLLKTGFTLGRLPISYLGLPLSPKEWSKMECHQLIEKITQRITTVYSKKLSYADRLQVVNTVLFSIHSFSGVVSSFLKVYWKRWIASVEITFGGSNEN